MGEGNGKFNFFIFKGRVKVEIYSLKEKKILVFYSLFMLFWLEILKGYFSKFYICIKERFV